MHPSTILIPTISLLGLVSATPVKDLGKKATRCGIAVDTFTSSKKDFRYNVVVREVDGRILGERKDVEMWEGRYFSVNTPLDDTVQIKAKKYPIITIGDVVFDTYDDAIHGGGLCSLHQEPDGSDKLYGFWCKWDC